jgi:hypothetical protein
MAREKNVGEYGSKDHQEQGGLLNLAQMLGSVSQACKMMGFDEILRVVDSMQLTAKHKVATLVNWKPGQDAIILPSVSDAEAEEKFPGGWSAPKPYLRIVTQPK